MDQSIVNRAYDIFISYCHADKGPVRAIASAFEARGLQVWMDATRIEDFHSITNSIEQGLAHSKVLLAYYSKEYPRSRACQWELTAAFLAGQQIGDPRERVLVVNPENGTDHISPIELRDALFRPAPALHNTAAIHDLAARVKARVSQIHSLLGEGRRLAPKRWFGRKPIDSPRFVGRLRDMWEIHSRLFASDNVIITGASKPGTTQIRGLGGIGKSLLAEEYALRFGAAYPGGIFWLSAHGNDDVKASLIPEDDADRTAQIRAFAVMLGITVEDVDPATIDGAVARAIDLRGLPCLWVVDDLASKLDADSVRKWLAPHPLAKTLFTTRSREYAALAHSYDLDVLADEDAFELLAAHRKPTSPQEIDAAHKLVRDLGGHALAIEVTGAAAEHLPGDAVFRHLREQIGKQDQDILELAAEFADVLPSGHTASIAATLLHSINAIGEEGRDSLRVASILATEPIPDDLLVWALRIADNLDEEEASLRYARASRQLSSYSLAERKWSPKSSVLVHSLVARTIRLYCRTSERREALRAAVVMYLAGKLSVVADPRTHGRLDLEIVHARAMCRTVTNWWDLELLNLVAHYDLARGLYVSAEALFKRRYAILCETEGATAPEVLAAMQHLAMAVLGQGRWEDARGLQESVLRECRSAFGERDPNTLASMTNLAATFHELGDLASARKLQEEVLEIRRTMSGPDDPSTLTTMNHLAVLLHSQGDWEGARRYAEYVLTNRLQILGEDHLDTINSASTLALILASMGDCEAVSAALAQVYEARKRVLGEEHPHTLVALSNLAIAASDLGDLEGACEMSRTVLENHRKTLGDEHPETLGSMEILGELLRRRGDLGHAYELQKLTCDSFRRMLGDEHPRTINSMGNLALTLHDQGDLTTSAELGEKVLNARRRALGNEHVLTFTAANNYAMTLLHLGDHVDARPLAQEAFLGRSKALGTDHPDTLEAMSNLAGVLREQGDLAGARQLYEQAAGILGRVLGEDDPRTRIVARSLAATVALQSRRSSNRAFEKIAFGGCKAGRNDLCPCGSGKKYKRCHGR